jgi:DNA-binding IclR family transcriptional regulator
MMRACFYFEKRVRALTTPHQENCGTTNIETIEANTVAPKGRGIHSVVVGGRLLQVLVATAQPMTLKDLAAAAKVHPAQAHAYLRSFREIGLIEQDASTGRYQLGPFALELGLVRIATFNPLRWIDKVAYDFSLRWGCLVSIAVWANAGPTAVQVHQGPREMNVNVRPGRTYPLIDVTVGRVFAAFLPLESVEAQIRTELREGVRHPGRGTPDTFEEWMEIAAIARQKGYVAIENSPAYGMNSAAAPIFDHNSLVQYAFHAVGFARRLPVEEGSPIILDLLRVTSEVSAQLGQRLQHNRSKS